MKQRKILPFTYPQHPLKQCGIFVGLVLIALLLVSSAGAVTNVAICPENPVVGDDIIIQGCGTPNSVLTAYTSFTVEVPVEDCFYEYEFKNIKVPEGTDTFSVEAEKVLDLCVAVKKFGIPYSRSSSADGSGCAAISQSYVLPSTYKVSISGHAQSTEDTVNLTFKGISKIKTDSTGYFEACYKTNTVPAGMFIVKIDGQTFEIELLEKKDAKGKSSDKSSSKTGTELAIVPATQSASGAGDQGTDDEAGSEENETQFEAAPDDVLLPEENVTGTIDTQPQPGMFQNIISWLKGLFK